MEHAAVLDVPETESLGFKNLDDYRVMAGGRDMAGHTILSCEAICYNGAAYNTTLGRQQRQPDRAEPGALHPQQHLRRGREPGDDPRLPLRRRARTSPGRASPPSRPTTTARSASARRGGRAPRSGSTCPASPPTSPAPSSCCRPARRSTTSSFLRQKGWASTGIGAFWVDQQRHPSSAGPTPSRRRPCSTCRWRRSAVAGWRRTGRRTRRSIVGPDQFRSQRRHDGRRRPRERVLELGRAGLPIVLVGDWSDGRAGRPARGHADAEAAEVRDLMAQIEALPTTRVASADAEIPARARRARRHARRRARATRPS